jgi:hypothetical protein
MHLKLNSNILEKVRSVQEEAGQSDTAEQGSDLKQGIVPKVFTCTSD